MLQSYKCSTSCNNYLKNIINTGLLYSTDYCYKKKRQYQIIAQHTLGYIIFIIKIITEIKHIIIVK